MTIIIGLRTPTGAVLGSDSQLNWGSTKIMGTKKILEAGRFLLGITGPARLGTLIQEGRTKISRATSPAKLAMVLRELISADDWKIEGENAGPKATETSILVGIKKTGDLYWMDGSFSVEPVPMGGFICLGSGDDMATGAMEALRGLEPEDHVRRALEITCQFNAYCGGELDIRRFGHE